MKNIIDLLSVSALKLKMDSIIQAGYIDSNKNILIQRLSHYQTGLHSIDSLERKTREIISEKFLTELRKEIRQASKKGSVVLKDADIILKNILKHASQNLHLYKHATDTDSKMFNF